MTRVSLDLPECKDFLKNKKKIQIFFEKKHIIFPFFNKTQTKPNKEQRIEKFGNTKKERTSKKKDEI